MAPSKVALYGVFEKALNEQPHKWIQDLVPLAERIQAAIDCIQD